MSDEPIQPADDEEADEVSEADPEAGDVPMPASPPAEPTAPQARQTPTRRMMAPPPEVEL